MPKPIKKTEQEIKQEQELKQELEEQDKQEQSYVKNLLIISFDKILADYDDGEARKIKKEIFPDGCDVKYAYTKAIEWLKSDGNRNNGLKLATSIVYAIPGILPPIRNTSEEIATKTLSAIYSQKIINLVEKRAPGTTDAINMVLEPAYVATKMDLFDRICDDVVKAAVSLYGNVAARLIEKTIENFKLVIQNLDENSSYYKKEEVEHFKESAENIIVGEVKKVFVGYDKLVDGLQNFTKTKQVNGLNVSADLKALVQKFNSCKKLIDSINVEKKEEVVLQPEAKEESQKKQDAVAKEALQLPEENKQKKEDITVVQKEPEQDKVVNDAQAVAQQIEPQKESVLEQIDKSLAQAQIKQEESQEIDSKTKDNVQQEQLQVHEAQPGASQTEQKNNEAIDLPVETEIKNQENNQEINPSLEEKIDQNLKTQADDNSNNIDYKENTANNFNNTDTDNKENIETEQKEEDVQKEDVVVQKETNQQKNIVIETVRPPISIREPVHQNDTRLGVLTQTKEIPGLKDKIRATYYEILGLKDGASIIEVNKSYKELSKIFHPDRFHDARVMEIINNARDIARQTSKDENSKLYVPEKEKLSIETKYIDPQATQQKIILLGSVLEKLIAANNAQLIEINANEPLLTLKEMKPAENAQSQESEQAKAVENVQIVQQADQNFLQEQQEAGNTQADEKELEYTQKDNKTEEIAQVKTSDIISEMSEIQQNDHEGYKTLEIQQQPFFDEITQKRISASQQYSRNARHGGSEEDNIKDVKKVTLEEKYKQLMERVKSYVAIRAKAGPLGLQWLFKIIYKNIASKIVNNWKKSVVAGNRKIEENIEQKIIDKIGPRPSG